MSSTSQAESNDLRATGAANAGAVEQLFDETDEGGMEHHHDSSRLVTPGTNASSSKTFGGMNSGTLLIQR